MPTIGVGRDLHPSKKSLPPMKEESKLLSRLLAKEEDSCRESSFRACCYDDGSSGVAVPFIWESTPGTPKHSLFSAADAYYNNMPPPLTPPPSYHSKHVVVALGGDSKSVLQNQKSKTPSSSSKKNIRLLRSIFGHRHVSRLSWTSSSSVSSSSSYDSSSYSTPRSFSTSSSSSKSRIINGIFHRRWSSLSSSSSSCRPRWSSPLHFAEDDEEHTAAAPGSPTSTLCFAIGRKNGNTTDTSQQGFRGCFQWPI